MIIEASIFRDLGQTAGSWRSNAKYHSNFATESRSCQKLNPPLDSTPSPKLSHSSQALASGSSSRRTSSGPRPPFFEPERASRISWITSAHLYGGFPVFNTSINWRSAMSNPRRKRLFSVMRLISLGVKAGKSFGMFLRSVSLQRRVSGYRMCPCLVLSSIGKKAEPAFPTHLCLCPEQTIFS